MYRKLIFSTIAFLTLISCEKFVEGTINYVEFPEHESQISANLIVSDVTTELKAFVSKTVSVTNTIGPMPIDNAVITLKDENGVVLYTLSTEDFDGEFYTLPMGEEINIPDGEIYLEVDVPDYDIANASTRMPAGAVFDVEYEEAIDTASMWGYEYIRDRYHFDFENNLEQNEAYLIFIEAVYLDKYSGELTDWTPMLAESNLDARILNLWMNYGILVSDESVRNDINGLNDIYIFTENKDEYYTIIDRRIRIESLSDELKKFYISLQEYEDNQYSLFAEPDLIYSNVSTGFGCFGMYRYELVDL